MSRYGNYPITEEYKERVKQNNALADEFCLSLSKTSWLSFDQVKSLFYKCKSDRAITKELFDYWSTTGRDPVGMLSLAGNRGAAAVLKLNEAVIHLRNAAEETTAKMRRIVEMYNISKTNERQHRG